MSGTGLTQERDREERRRWLRLVEAQQLSSVMNETRWRRAFDALEAIEGYTPQFRVKLIDQPEPDPATWTRGFEHAGWTRAIEWMDIHPGHDTGVLVERDFAVEITSALRRSGARFSVEGDLIRIWGYLRPGCSPAFC